MGCKTLYGMSNACGDLLFPGGTDPDFYVGYLSDLSTRFSLTQTGPITSLGFTAYNGLVRFSGQKFAHSGTWPVAFGAGGNSYFEHTYTAKLIALSTQDDVEVQRLLQATDAFIIAKNNNDSFLIYGPGAGLKGQPGDLGGTGKEAADDVSDTVILKGAEKVKPLRFLVTDVATTIAYLNARVI